jgi:drug/metabolite transporter (DMT)-like permease
MPSSNKQAITLGLGAALLFSVTFILNRLMSLNGGSWVWSSSLRFYWMLPFFTAIVWYKRGIHGLLVEIRKNISQWLIWSTVGFGLFYAPLTYAAAYTPSWLLAGTWQFTIVAGMLVAPFVSQTTTKGLPDLHSSAMFSGVILLGIITMQVSHAQQISLMDLLKGVIPVLVAAFAYPLGNRKMMHLLNGKLDVYQRVLGMTICSMPFWLLLSIYEINITKSVPSSGQYIQTFIVAVFSGVLATVLFFSATDKARHDEKQLAAVEATQSTEVLFALIGEIIMLNSPLPGAYSIAGLTLVILGMVLHSTRS